MNKLLILQLRPEDITANEEYEAFLKVGRVKQTNVERIRADKQDISTLDPSNYQAIIVGGSPFDISTPNKQKSQLQLTIEQEFNRMFDTIIAKDIPFLGACSGNGLLGNYCGTTISAKYGEPVSAIDVSLTKFASSDPLLAGFPKQFRALVGHKEACDSVPDQAVLLVTSKNCPVQMFRIKQNIYATQFHPEASPQIFTTRVNVYKNHCYFKPEEAKTIIDNIKDEDVSWTNEILTRFIKLYIK